MVPHLWLLQSLSVAGVANSISQILRNSMANIKTELIAAAVKHGKRGIFQRGSLPRQLFVDVMILLTHMLWECNKGSPPDDVNELLECYDTTLQSLVDKHVPLRMRWVTCQSKARWFDTECTEIKRKTRKLECIYHCLCTEEAETAGHDQYQHQRRLYEDKFTSYWWETVDKYRTDVRSLCRAATDAPQQSSTGKLSTYKFADFFRDKIAMTRQSTATVTPPVIEPRHSVPLQLFDPVTNSEIHSLLATTPATYCPLDPIPTWLLKELSPYMYQLFDICITFLSKQALFPRLKQALVQPRVKNPILDPDQLKSYRPISKIPYISKVTERVVAKRFISHTSDLLPIYQVSLPTKP